MSIKEKIIEYRAAQPAYRTLLGTVIGELDRISKTPTDEQTIQVIKKMMEANNEINNNDTLEENFILSMFLPTQLSETQIQGILDECQFKTIKDCMTFFKDNYLGRYDGKLVSKLFNTK